MLIERTVKPMPNLQDLMSVITGSAGKVKIQLVGNLLKKLTQLELACMVLNTRRGYNSVKVVFLDAASYGTIRESGMADCVFNQVIGTLFATPLLGYSISANERFADLMASLPYREHDEDIAQRGKSGRLYEASLHGSTRDFAGKFLLALDKSFTLHDTTMSVSASPMYPVPSDLHFHSALQTAVEMTSVWGCGLTPDGSAACPCVCEVDVEIKAWVPSWGSIRISPDSSPSKSLAKFALGAGTAALPATAAGPVAANSKLPAKGPVTAAAASTVAPVPKTVVVPQSTTNTFADAFPSLHALFLRREFLPYAHSIMRDVAPSTTA
jgi:hypothetical protein